MESASPQLEDGFTRIANALFEALCAADCPSSVLRLTMAVIRETYGYNQKTARIPTHRLAAICRCSERRVRQVLDEALAWGMLVREGREIGPQKDFSRWAKPEGPSSEKRKVPLPAFFKQSEGPSSEKRKEDLPQRSEPLVLETEGPPSEKSEGPPSAKGKDIKDKRQRKAASADKPRGGEHAALTDRAWTGLGLPGSPDGRLYGFTGKRKKGTGLKLFREWVDHLESVGPLESYDPTADEADWFQRAFNYAMGCKPGQGWRKLANGPSPERQSWEGWPSRLAEPDMTFRPTPEEIDAMARSPDWEKFPHLDKFMVAPAADRIREARKAWEKARHGPT